MIPWAVLLRGVAMGIAEIVPGVSGGTIAFVTGIYDELMRTLVGLSSAAASLAKLEWREAWRKANGGFLLPLVIGMSVGALLFAQVFAVLIARYPAPVAGFFLGVIAMSGLIVARTAWRDAADTRARSAVSAIGVVGVVAGWALTLVTGPNNADPSLLLVGVGGFIAISAWMVPGVSGSMLLLLLGVYPAVLDAVAGFDFVILLPLVIGMTAGLIVAPRFFVHLLDRFRAMFLMFLAAVMLASTHALNPFSGAADVPLLATLATIVVGASLVFWGARSAAS